MFSLGSDTEIAEERRVLYVALTRGRDTVQVCLPETIDRMTKEGPRSYPTSPSRFLGELGIG
jgi:superfamily I DNA/RNA helicase